MDDEAKEILSRSLVHQIERLRAELAAQADIHTEIQMRLSDERDALRKKLNEASEALEPFSLMATELEYEGSKWRDHETQWMQTFGFKLEPTVGDLRRARAVYAKIKGIE